MTEKKNKKSVAVEAIETEKEVTINEIKVFKDETTEEKEVTKKASKSKGSGRKAFHFDHELFLKLTPLKRIEMIHDNPYEFIEYLKKIDCTSQITMEIIGFQTPGNLTDVRVSTSGKADVTAKEAIALVEKEGKKECLAELGYNQEDSDNFLRAMHRALERYKMVIGLCDDTDAQILRMRVEGYTNLDIGSKMGISAAAVSKRITRVGAYMDQKVSLIMQIEKLQRNICHHMKKVGDSPDTEAASKDESKTNKKKNKKSEKKSDNS